MLYRQADGVAEGLQHRVRDALVDDGLDPELVGRLQAE
jgi:hypothetical protein